jgi:hypothetical protein
VFQSRPSAAPLTRSQYSLGQSGVSAIGANIQFSPAKVSRKSQRMNLIGIMLVSTCHDLLRDSSCAPVN